ncbi:MMPL family transporter [Actinomyces ruminicola]|uniref:Putative drug exporter of the RND superfamily n=1 Tax=Actinomyces ruminicola TaxID=332524 RepID=A0A1G9Y6N4_9ACTO|nr:MMPL family transporter [Actinomyces ruminicola]SDN04748.1 putative drug exporter of the RND superfamily [Actinomyces ruminicola]
MLAWLSRRVVKDAWIVVGTWALVALACLVASVTGLGGSNLFERAVAGSQSISGTQSAAGEQILATLSGDAETVSLLVTDIDISEPGTQQAVADALEDAHADLRALVGEQNVIDPFVVPGMLSEPAAQMLASADLDGFLMVVTVDPNGDAVAAADDDAYAREVAQLVARVEARLAQVPDELGGVEPSVRGIVSDDTLMVNAVNDQVRADLFKGKLISLPLALLIMVLVFGGFLTAGMPLFGALVSIAGTMGVLYALSFTMDLQSFVINIVTVISLGLSIDYGLLVTSRYREELARSRDAEDAATSGRRRRRRTGRRDPLITACVTTTLTTAGRTVLFSALTVAACMLGLALVGTSILRSIGVACLASCLIAVTAALTLVPAVLVLLGRRMLRPPLLQRIPVVGAVQRRLGDVTSDKGLFRWIARQVQRMAWVVLVACVVALVVLASPARNLHLLTSTTELLPTDSDQRTYLTILEENYSAVTQQDATLIIAATGDRVTDFINADVAAVDGIAEVLRVATAGDYTVVYLDLAAEPSSRGAEEAVASIRALAAPADMWVTGQAADQLDFRQATLTALPWVGGFIVLVTFILLFLMTGSLLVPLKALVINLLSLAASLGVLAWVFQEGHLTGVLGFTPIGGVEAYVVVTAIGVGFGLAMDYEVFLLGRVKEYWDAGADNDTAVAKGLQRSGRIVTFAALIMVVVFLGFVSGELLIVKEIGLALAIVVALDATLVRMLLVPATMTLLGRWNWWAPESLKRVYDRYGLADVPARPPAPSVPATEAGQP